MQLLDSIFDQCIVIAVQFWVKDKDALTWVLLLSKHDLRVVNGNHFMSGHLHRFCYAQFYPSFKPFHGQLEDQGVNHIDRNDHDCIRIVFALHLKFFDGWGLSTDLSEDIWGAEALHVKEHKQAFVCLLLEDYEISFKLETDFSTNVQVQIFLETTCLAIWCLCK